LFVGDVHVGNIEDRRQEINWQECETDYGNELCVQSKNDSGAPRIPEILSLSWH